MAKRILVTSTDLMMAQFLIPHIKNLSENGYQVEIACSDVGGRINEIRQKLDGVVHNVYVVRLHRSPIKPSNYFGYKEMKKVIDHGHYDIIWTNEPVMGVVTRLAAQRERKNGTKILYMVHGFHFYKGAPKLNWMVYYPIERVMATKADIICVVNQEDYNRAKTFYANRVEYIHGIGINTSRLNPSAKQFSIREELGLKQTDFIVLSIGELNENKNQKVIIQALAQLNDSSIHYILCGKGAKQEYLHNLASESNIEKNVHFLGYRNDVVDICSQADVFVMPSRREGLPVASLEAMYCGLPLITSNIRGLIDIMSNEETGYTLEPDDVYGFAQKIKLLKDDPAKRKKMGILNKEKVKPYCIENTMHEVLNILNSI